MFDTNYPTERTDAGARDERYGPVAPLPQEWKDAYNAWHDAREVGQ